MFASADTADSNCLGSPIDYSKHSTTVYTYKTSMWGKKKKILTRTKCQTNVLGCLCSGCWVQKTSTCSVTLAHSTGRVIPSDAARASWPTCLVLGGQAGTHLRAPPFPCLS